MTLVMTDVLSTKHTGGVVVVEQVEPGWQ